MLKTQALPRLCPVAQLPRLRPVDNRPYDRLKIAGIAGSGPCDLPWIAPTQSCAGGCAPCWPAAGASGDDGSDVGACWGMADNVKTKRAPFWAIAVGKGSDSRNSRPPAIQVQTVSTRGKFARCEGGGCSILLAPEGESTHLQKSLTTSHPPADRVPVVAGAKEADWLSLHCFQARGAPIPLQRHHWHHGTEAPEASVLI
jgi:hypothetical protein